MNSNTSFQPTLLGYVKHHLIFNMNTLDAVLFIFKRVISNETKFIWMKVELLHVVLQSSKLGVR